MNNTRMLNADRLFPCEMKVRDLARILYREVKDLPIISPHGHCDPRWFAENQSFDNPVDLLIKPDHYLLRMFYSQGISLESLGIKGDTSDPVETEPRKIWQTFCDHYYLFRGTPSQIWLDYAIYEVFGVTDKINSQHADAIYNHLMHCFSKSEFLPRALFERFNIEVLATTESPLDSLQYHQHIQDSHWDQRVITTFRPDPVVDPEFEGFIDNIKQLGEITKTDTQQFDGYLQALKQRRQFFKSMGATATDHGHPTANTANLGKKQCEKLYKTILSGRFSEEDAELFRAQMLSEMAKMSLEDGLVMQIHPGSWRNHNPQLFTQFGRDKGADIPMRTDYVKALKPLLDLYGNEKQLTIVLFTLDESTYSRELAPLAGHYPALKLGPAWWFHDSVEGMRRYRQLTTETAGFYNTVGFNDDTRAFVSIPARHDMARRIDCGYLANLVCEHRLDEAEALELAIILSGSLAKESYKL